MNVSRTRQSYNGNPGSTPWRWNGHYEQFGTNHVMELVFVVDSTSVFGQGQDEVSAFDVQG